MLFPAEGVKNGNLIPLEESVDPVLAGLIEPLACVLRGQRMVHINPGDIVLVIGYGPIGAIHARLASLHGAGKIIVSEINRERQYVARQHGFTTIDPVEQDLTSAVNNLSQDKGADVILVATPNHNVMAEVLNAAAIGGRVNYFAGLPKNKPDITLNANLVHYKELLITGSFACSTDDCWQAAGLVNNGQIKLIDLVSKQLPLKNTVEGLKEADNREGMKIALIP